MLWWITATLCAFFVKGLCGFANTLVFTTMLSFTQNNLLISPVELVVGFPTNAILAWDERRNLNWRMWLPISLMLLAGSIPGIFLLKNVEANIIKVFFGVLIILVALEMMFRERSSVKMEQSRVVSTIIGICSGILCGLFGVGVLVGAYFSRVTKDTHTFKGNLAMVFVVENVFRLITYSVSGVITAEALVQAAWLAPFMLIALWLGMRASRVLDEKIAKKLVLVLLMVSGAALIINSL